MRVISGLLAACGNLGFDAGGKITKVAEGLGISSFNATSIVWAYRCIFGSALFPRHGDERRDFLLHFFTFAFGTGEFPFCVLREVQAELETFFALMAEKLVDGHGTLLLILLWEDILSEAAAASYPHERPGFRQSRPEWEKTPHPASFVGYPLPGERAAVQFLIPTLSRGERVDRGRRIHQPARNG
ncbi:MAG: hypothetical protein ACRD3O_13415 [Terriglobia bacterium]